MRIFPAIDLQDGAAVQLVGGDPSREEIRETDPLAVASRWVEQGAGLLHIVDLDAALGQGSNLHIVDRILRNLPRPVQLGGGVRSLLDIQKRLDMGVGRIIVGTQGVKHHAWLEEACRIFPDRIVLAIDARGDEIAISGWQEASGLTVQDVLERTSSLPLAAVLYTNIDVEGGLGGIDASAVESVVRHSAHPVIASGGIATMEDLDTLAALGVDAAVLGMSLYTGRIQLKEAIERMEGRKVQVSRHVMIPQPAVQWGSIPGGVPPSRVVGGFDDEDDLDVDADLEPGPDDETPGDGMVYIDDKADRARPRDVGSLWGRRRHARPADEDEDEDDEVDA